MNFTKLDLSWNIIYDNRSGTPGWNYWVCGKSIEIIPDGMLVAWNYDQNDTVLGVNLVYDSSKWSWANSFIAKINPTTGEAK